MLIALLRHIRTQVRGASARSAKGPAEGLKPWPPSPLPQPVLFNLRYVSAVSSSLALVRRRPEALLHSEAGWPSRSRLSMPSLLPTSSQGSHEERTKVGCNVSCGCNPRCAMGR